MAEAREVVRALTAMANQGQYLREEGIYALNRVLEEIQDELERKERPAMAPKDLVIVPVLFNKKHRSFHLAAVLGKGWGPKNKRTDAEFEETVLKKAIKFIWELDREEFNAAANNQIDGTSYAKARQTLLEALKRDAGRFRKQQLNQDPILQAELIEALHLFYYGFKSHRLLNLAGFIYRDLEQHGRSHRLQWWAGERADDAAQALPDYFGCSYVGPNKPVSEKARYKQGVVLDQTGNCILSDRQVNERRPTKIFNELIYLLYANELRRRTEADGGVSSGGPLLIIPIYDTWIGGQGMGGLWGCLLCTFSNDDTRTTFLRETFNDHFLPRCEAIADEMFRSGLAAISAEPAIPPYDLIEHFVRLLPHVQDWERVTVYKEHSDKPCYSYRRKPGDPEGDQEWERCDKDCASGGHAVRWDSSSFFPWRQELCNDLNAEEVLAYSRFTLEFEFPQTVWVPTNFGMNEIGDHFAWSIFRQQIEVLRLLIPKLRAQRYAARAAAAAIMSRNMSHNIGSHPLAALTTPANVDAAGDGRTADFLGYIRSRMDYIASICTDVPRWAVTADLHEVLKEFTVDAQHTRPWLLESLTELETKPDIKWDGGTNPCPFLLPHGVVGKHALFSIFENALRNSEKYGTLSGRGQARLRIDTKDPEFITVTLVDFGSAADSDVIKGLQEKLNEPFYVSGGDREGELNRNYWGLKEMRISAAYLRMQAGQDAETYEAPVSTRQGTEARPWIKPVIEPCDDSQQILGWRFLLLKPQVALVLGDELKPDVETLTACRNYGTAFCTFNELKDRLHAGEKFPQSFLVVSRELWQRSHADLDAILSQLPLRRILAGANRNNAATGWAWWEKPDFEDPNNLGVRLYECWNGMLSANAANGPMPTVVLATKDPGEMKEPYALDTGCVVAKEQSISRCDKPLWSLLDSKQFVSRPIVVLERHADRDGGIYHYRPGCCFKKDTCDHDQLWARAQAFFGVEIATAEFQQAKSAETNEETVQRLIESALVLIVVVDDREAIQRLVSSRFDQKKFAAAGTTIIKFENPANISDTDIAPNRLAEHVKAFRARFTQVRPGMVIATIHQTILDKLKLQGGSAAEWTTNTERDLPELLKVSNSDRPVPVTVIVHSGRGRPGDMYSELKGRRFLEFSNVQSLLVSPGQKALLADILLSVRA